MARTPLSRIASVLGTFVVVLAMAAAAQAAPPLVAQWPLEEAHTSGGSDYTEDVSGNGLALTSPAGTMQFGTESGKFGGYLASTNTTTLEVNSPLLAPAQVTLLAWVKQSGNPGTLHYIAGRGDDGGTCGGSSYALYTGYSGDPGLHFYIRSGEANILTDAPTVLASQDHPYTIQAGDAGGTLKGLVGQTYYSPTVAIGGTVSVEPYPEVGLELGGAYLLYSYPDFIAAKGYAHLQTFLFTVNAEGSVELSTSTRRFNALIKGEVCLLGGIEILGFNACAGAEARVSSRGISVCFDIAGWKPGVGYVYGATLPEFFTGLPGDGCKPSHFWEKEVRAARASAVAPITFTVKRGEQAKSIRLTGAGGAPEVSLRTPGGETITSRPNKMFHSGNLSAISADKYKATWLGVEHAKPGTYQIVSQPGSPAITGMAETHYEPGAGVSGKLTHKGRSYTLHYNAGHASGQKVTFVERGKDTLRPLRTVSAGKGTIVFEPALGQAGPREIAAEVEVDGIPASPQKLARFSAPAPRRAGRVTHVRVTRGHGAIAVSWRTVPFAKSYSVILRQHGGGVRTLRVKGSAHSVRLRSILATEAGKIEVIAFGPLGDQGQAGKASFKALSKEQTRLLSFKELGKGAPYTHHTKGSKRRG